MKFFYRIMDNITHSLTKFMSYMSVVLLVAIVMMIFKESISIFKSVSLLNFISGTLWRPTSETPQIGVMYMILGTLYSSILGLLISLPIGIGAALYLTLMQKGRVKVIILALIDMLAGVPSVVYGFFSFMTIVIFFERHLNRSTGESFLAAGITLAIMILPLMISTMNQSFEKIYQVYKSQGKALGVTDVFMIRNLVLPAGIKGVLLGTLLSFSRALGETMAVLMVIGNSVLAPTLMGKGITLSGVIALEMGSAVIGSEHYKALYASGAVLIVILIMINLIFGYIKRRMIDDV